MFTTFSESLSDPPTRNRMQAHTTKASASLGHEAITSMKGSSQTRTSAWAHVDISITISVDPVSWQIVRHIASWPVRRGACTPVWPPTQNPTHTRSAHTLDEPRSLWWQVGSARRDAREGVRTTTGLKQVKLGFLYVLIISSPKRLPRAHWGYDDRRLPSTRSSNARPSGRRGLLATRVVARLSPSTELLLAQKEWYRSESKMLASRTRANCVAFGS